MRDCAPLARTLRYIDAEQRLRDRDINRFSRDIGCASVHIDRAALRDPGGNQREIGVRSASAQHGTALHFDKGRGVGRYRCRRLFPELKRAARPEVYLPFARFEGVVERRENEPTDIECAGRADQYSVGTVEPDISACG